MKTALTAILLGHLVATPITAEAFCHLTTTDPAEGELCSTHGKTLAWFNRCSTLQLLPRTKQDIPDSLIRTTIQKSFDTWDVVRCDGELVGLTTDLSATPATENMPRHGNAGPNQNVIMFVDSETVWRDRMNPVAAIGLTSVFHSKATGQIVGADMEINDWRGTLGICGNRCTIGLTDLQNVLTHEAGHYYGLGHVSDPNATMYFQAPPLDIAKRDLDVDDINGLCDTYPAGTFDAGCTGSVFADMYKDTGCGCSTLGRVETFRAWWLGLPLLVLLRLGVSRRKRRGLVAQR